jgi:ATP-binding cassette subfamily B (MDR/TAP) protein 1
MKQQQQDAEVEIAPSSHKVEVPSEEKATDKKAAVSQVSVGKYLRYADRKDWLMMGFGIFCAIVNGCGLPAFSVAFGQLLNSFGDGQDVTSKVSRIALVFLIIGILVGLAQTFQVTCWKLAALNQINRIRQAYIRAILRKDITWFDTRKVAELSAQMDSDCKLIQDGMSDKVSAAIQFLSMFFAGIIVGFTQGWQLTLIIFAVTPLLAIGGALLTKFLGEMSSKSQKTYGKAGAIASQAIHAMPTVSQCNAQEKEAGKYDEAIKEAQKIGERKSRITGAMMGYTQGMMFATYGLALWYGAKLIADGTINNATQLRYTGGDVISVFFSVLIGAFALGQAAPNFPAITNGRVSAYRIYNIIDGIEDAHENQEEKMQSPTASTVMPSGKEEGRDGKILDKIEGNLVFENVSFSYPSRPEVKVLDNLSFEVRKGETIALVGESGSGKSTIVSLIERFYEPSSGRILLDGTDISSLDIIWLRKQLGLVSQQPALFSGTIADNIRVGDVNASQEDIEQASKMANAHDFISNLPNAYETPISGSSQLSGGQKQRIAIARAVIKKPSIMLFDEATSALDNKSEAVVQASLENVMKNHTSILIAHRLSTVRQANRIFVFQKGQIVESGSHDDLMQLNGLYKTLVEAQNLNASAEAKVSENDQLDSDVTQNKEDEGRIERKKSSKNDSKFGSTDPDKYDIENDVVKKNAAKVPLKDAFVLLKVYWKLILLSLISSALSGAIFPSFSFIFSEMVGIYYLLDYEEMNRKAIIWMISFFVLAAAMALLSFTGQALYGFLGEYLTFTLRQRMFKHILRQDIGFFDINENAPGILTTRLATDAESVRALIVDRIRVVVEGAFMIVLGLGLGFYYGWQLTLVVLAVGPIIGISGSLQMKFMATGGKKAKEAFEKANAHSSEAIAQIRTVKSFTREDVVVENYAKALELPLIQERKGAWISGIAPGFSQFFLFNVYGFVFYIGALFEKQGLIDFDGILKVFFAVVISFMSAGQVTQFAPDAANSSLAINAIFDLLNKKSLIDGIEENDGEKGKVGSTDIEFSNVKFTYPARKEVQVLKGLNIRVKAGKTVGLVGPSGSGKSTVISLLQRFYDYEGSIYIGGTEMRQFNVKYLRSKIGVVNQEPVLFDGTIKENILYGRPDASEADLQLAIEQANVAPFLKNLEYIDADGVVHKGIDAVIGGKGIQLSGGQKQRVAIARAILKNPEILLLDEATSALDNESEKLVQEALENVMKGRTTIVIAHRLSTIKNADYIIVMEGGLAIEEGTHDELLNKNGIYANLVRIGQRN